MYTNVKAKLFILGAAIAMMLTTQSTMAAERVGDPYTLDTCAVSGKGLRAKGEPFVILVEGREYKTCCSKCKEKLEADPSAFVDSVDERIIKQQAKHYPLTTCLISGKPVKEHGEPVNLVVNNRLVQLCCDGCKDKFKADPAKFLAKLDEAVIEKQDKEYALKKCPISGEKLGDNAKNIVVGNRLVKLCCAGCEKKVLANPDKVIAMLDAGKVTTEGSSKKKAE